MLKLGRRPANVQTVFSIHDTAAAAARPTIAVSGWLYSVFARKTNERHLQGNFMVCLVLINTIIVISGLCCPPPPPPSTRQLLSQQQPWTSALLEEELGETKMDLFSSICYYGCSKVSHRFALFSSRKDQAKVMQCTTLPVVVVVQHEQQQHKKCETMSTVTLLQ